MKTRIPALLVLLAAALAAGAGLYGDPRRRIEEPFDAFVYRYPYARVLVAEYALSAAEAERLDGKGAFFALRVDAENGGTLLGQRWPLDTAEFRVAHQLKAELPEGRHRAVTALLAAEGAVLHALTNTLVCRTYAFEHNGIGEARTVIPPFEPVTARERTATVWGRTLVFGEEGLPRSVTVLGEDLLGTEGITLTSAQGGTRVGARAERPFSIATRDGYDATGFSEGTLGALRYRLRGTLEMDGFYRVDLELSAGGAPVAVDDVTLTLPFRAVDTYSFQKNDRDMRQHGGLSRFGGVLPGQEGVLFDARRLPPMTAYNIRSENFFVPAIYAGTALRGLWYYAESDWEWYLNPAAEHATLERVGGTTRLRVLLVNDRLDWTGTRRFTFALMPQPVKPQPPGWRKTAWSYPAPQLIHDTSGWRYYGDGVNAFTLPSDEHYRTLGRVLRGEEAPDGTPYAKGPRRAPDDPRPLVLYGSSLMAGTGPAEGEWEAYAAEWISPAFARRPPTDKTVFKNTVAERFGGKSSYAGFPWEDDISFHPASVGWTDSWIDFFLYYHRKLVRFAGVNGTWFDNQSCFTIDDFGPDGFNRAFRDNPLRFRVDGRAWNRSDHPAPRNYGRRSHLFQFRALTRRLATMCHEEGVAPFWMVNQHPAWSFCQFAWHVEGDYYAWNKERDMVDHAGLNGFRALVRSQGGLVPMLQAHIARPSQPPVEGRPDTYHCANMPALHVPDVARTQVGLCLLHDIGMAHGWPGVPFLDLLLRRMDTAFGFFDEGVAYLPYTEQREVAAESERVFTTLFRHPAGRALAVVFNEKKGAKGITTPLTVAAGLPSLGGAGTFRVRDLETGEPIPDLDPAEPGLQGVLYVPARDFRLLLVAPDAP